LCLTTAVASPVAVNSALLSTPQVVLQQQALLEETIEPVLFDTPETELVQGFCPTLFGESLV
jgi:hypothetical protein